MNSELRKKQIKNIKKIILIFIIVLLVSAPAFVWFRISTQAHIALREAKNVKLAIEMLEIEYYGKNASIFDASTPNGLRKGAQEEIEEITDQKAEITLQAYNKKQRKVTALTYRNQHYQVIYRYDQELGDHYTVDYMLPVIK